jgi:nucleoside 2-deoxyribosyltransferase
MTVVYLAGPLFSEAEQQFNRRLKGLLVNAGCEVFLPQEDSNDAGNLQHHRWHERIFQKNLEGIRKCDVMVAVLEGVDVDSGTAWEIGYAYALGKPVIGVRTDFRTLGAEGTVNLMVERSVTKLCRDVGEVVECVLECLHAR